MPQPFHPFSTQHFTAVAIGGVITTILLLAGKRGGKPRLISTGILAFLCLAAYPLSQAAWMTYPGDKSLETVLPFQLCDLAAITGAFALLSRRHYFATLTYFWGLAGTIQGLLTPAVTVGFPSAPFIMFFVQHFAIVAVALYLPIVEGWRPKVPFWRSPVEVMGCSLIYLVFALIINRLLGTNFGFVNHPPENPSLIDYLGPWPWYLVWMALIAQLAYLLLALPFAGRKLQSGK
ncbi:TIGR02206 family membrane protein [Luteolibacter pohnpeiensis]|uniref:TIGR02206 family membrane protein n=1 Tax=Luteolibacter pohnpeiensis TaxID=454153 RepID=A0A934VPR4_9BACT|nr:TIGR02206 family membrane protein [Luteolibacter pohnpeiensis]MBK1881301.1 TIGR02206 family membrane protein [Luteolibacter pohnpeiensis]